MKNNLKSTLNLPLIEYAGTYFNNKIANDDVRHYFEGLVIGGTFVECKIHNH